MSTVRPSDPAAPASLDLIVNGRAVSTAGVAPTTTLLAWLRANGLTGSKEGCAEGDCGACSVALVDRDAQGKPTYRAFNSCIALVPMFAGREIVTVEGLAHCGADKKQLHPVQAAMVEHYGSQCGYCTPGFVVSMFEAYYRDGCGALAGQRPALRQPLPLHGLPADPRCGDRRPGAASAGGPTVSPAACRCPCPAGRAQLRRGRRQKFFRPTSLPGPVHAA
jgi:aerobic-type carbon monoxide dehydrogenase small subunit (CoxS/CutS family)